MELDPKFAFELKYKDGRKEYIDRRLVIRYFLAPRNILPDRVRSGTGVGIAYLMALMRANEPIILAKKEGSVDDDNIERIIDTKDLREINHW